MIDQLTLQAAKYLVIKWGERGTDKQVAKLIKDMGATEVISWARRQGFKGAK